MIETPLPSLRFPAPVRIVVTRPPEPWFYGLARQYGDLYAASLRALGAEVLAVPVEPWSAGREDEQERVVRDIEAFRPDLAIGLHDAGYVLICRDHAGRNLFVDRLGLPTILLWDHGLLQFAPLLLGPLPHGEQQSRGGCLATFREKLSHPLYLHVARDSGHRDRVEELGILPRGRVLVEPAFAHPEFALVRSEPAPPPLAELAFFGHMRPERTIAGDCSDADQTWYWSLRCGEADARQARWRLEILRDLDRALDFFGDPGVEEIGGRVRRRPERFRFGRELGRAFAATRVVVDAVNPGFQRGFGTKVMNCFAAAGFMLIDRKPDFVACFGDLGEAVSYSTLDELRTKVDRFLGDDRARRAISEELGERIRSAHSFPTLMARLVERALTLRA